MDDEGDGEEGEGGGEDVTGGMEEASVKGETSASGIPSSSPVEGPTSSSRLSSPSVTMLGGGDGSDDFSGRPPFLDGKTNDDHYYDEGKEEDLFEILVDEIEELMEEDLEAAAMASFIGGPGADNTSCVVSGESSAVPLRAGGGGGGGCGGGSNNRGIAVGAIGRGPSSRGPGGTAGAVMGTVQQRAITTPGVSTKKKKSTITVVNTPPPCSAGGGGGGRADGDDATTSGGGAIEVPAVSRDQMARLRCIMARHHQLLLQQATLSVRAAYVQKVRKDGVGQSKVLSIANPSPATTTANASKRPVAKKGEYSTLPESRLDTRSLTFCINPYADSGCSYPNDFFGGETPEELSESLDGAVGMLQDLEQVIVFCFFSRSRLGQCRVLSSCIHADGLYSRFLRPFI